MSNRTIAGIFVTISWIMMIESVLIGAALFAFYGIICIFLSHKVFKDQK